MMSSANTEKETGMFWGFMSVLIAAALFIKLGMYSVWVSILSLTVKVGLIAILAFGAVLVWRRVYGRTRSIPDVRC